MRLPRNYFENLNAKRYREYLKLLPNMQHENTRIITTLIFTFVAMSFFGIFAINPTLSTIVTLKKELSDNTLVHDKLGTKIANLSALQQQYISLGPDLPVVFDAIPKTPKAPLLTGQIVALSQKTKVQIASLTVENVDLMGNKNQKSDSSYRFTLEVMGAYDDLLRFTKSLTHIDRIVSVESLSIGKSSSSAPNALSLNIHGTGYFKK